MTTFANNNVRTPACAGLPTSLRRKSAPWLLGAVVLALAACGGGGSGGSDGSGNGGSGGASASANGNANGSANGSTNGNGSANGNGNGGETSQNPNASPPATTPSETQTYYIGGKVSGLAGQGLVLQNNAGGDVAVTASGSFGFAAALASGAAYSVTVKSQPANPSQLCTVNAGSGKVSNTDVSTVEVACSTSSFLVGGSVSGLQGAGLVLQNNAGDDIAVDADGKFRFETAVASGAGYGVTVKAQPAGPTQTCSVNKGTGTMVNAAIDDVAVVCSTNSYTVAGSVTGLLGSGLVLANNGEDLPVDASAGGFAFAGKVASGSDYTVSVKAQPSNPSQTCSVAGGQGTIADAGVSTVGVTCTTNSYAVGIDLSGLDGVGLVLQNNGTDLPMDANGTGKSFTVASGASYSVTVKTQPTLVSQECTIGSNGTGTIGGADVTVAVSCKSFLPHFAYLTARNMRAGGKILPFSLDASTGALNSLGADFAENSSGVPTSMVIDGSGKHAYVASASGISQFDIANNGQLSAMATPKVNAGPQPASLTLDPKGRFAYVLNAVQGRISVLPIAAANGSLGSATQVSVGSSPRAFAVESSGRFVYVINTFSSKISTFAVNQASGSLTAAGSVDTKKALVNVEADASGRFLYAIVLDVLRGKYAVNAYAIGASGSLTDKGSVAVDGSQAPTGLVSHPSGRFAYVTLANGALRTFAVDATNGILAATGNESAAPGTDVLSAAVDASGRFMVVSTESGAITYAIDHAGGALGAPKVTNVPSASITSVALGR